MIGIDLVPERLERAASTAPTCSTCGPSTTISTGGRGGRELTGGRGPDAVIDAVGMEAHGSGGAKFAQTVTGLLPTGWPRR